LAGFAVRLRVVQPFGGSGAFPYLVGPIMEVEAYSSISPIVAKNRFGIGLKIRRDLVRIFEPFLILPPF
jgi:hypothetical protein